MGTSTAADVILHGERRGRREWDAALREWVIVDRPVRVLPRRRRRARDYKAVQRTKAVAEGKCPTCCSRPAEPPYKTCSTCRARNAKHFRELHRLAALARQARLA